MKPERQKLYKKAAKVTIQNAEDLFEEALLLFENKFYARSFSLGILTCEELAKAFIYHCVYLEILKEDEISKLIKVHEEKILKSGHLMAVAYLFSEHIEEITEAVEHDKDKPDHKDHKFIQVLNKRSPQSAEVVVKNIFNAQNLKLDSFYVQVRENQIIDPRKIVDRKKCDELFDLIGKTMSMLKYLCDNDEVFLGYVQKFLFGTITEIKETAKKAKEKKNNEVSR